jgi:hypothetical protein
MSFYENGSLAKEEAAGSTSKDAFLGMPIQGMALSKPTAQIDLFISFSLAYFSEKSQEAQTNTP